MIRSRLRQRRKTKTVDVKVKTLASGKYTEATVTGLDSLKPAYEPRSSIEATTDGGAVVVVTDVFWFEPLDTGSLPAIEEKHILVDSNSVRYEILSVTDQGGMDDRLMVRTRRLR